MSANASVLTMPRSAVAMLLECAVVRFRGAEPECCWAWKGAVRWLGAPVADSCPGATAFDSSVGLDSMAASHQERRRRLQSRRGSYLMIAAVSASLIETYQFIPNQSSQGL